MRRDDWRQVRYAQPHRGVLPSGRAGDNSCGSYDDLRAMKQGLSNTGDARSERVSALPESPALVPELPALRAKLLRHARLVLRDSNLAEDLTQDTLVAVLQFHAQRRGDAALSTWAISILKNKIADWYRSPARTRVVLAGDAEEKLDARIDRQFDAEGAYAQQIPAWQQPEGAEENRQMFAVLEACVSCLPTQMARVFMMREWLGFDTAEICQRLQVTAENVRTMLHRARMGLRECMQRKWLEPRGAV